MSSNHPNRNRVNDWPRYLKEYRARNDLTQKKLADMLQISARNVENWEEGIHVPPPFLKRALRWLEEKC